MVDELGEEAETSVVVVVVLVDVDEEEEEEADAEAHETANNEVEKSMEDIVVNLGFYHRLW